MSGDGWSGRKSHLARLRRLVDRPPVIYFKSTAPRYVGNPDSNRRSPFQLWTQSCRLLRTLLGMHSGLNDSWRISTETQAQYQFLNDNNGAISLETCVFRQSKLSRQHSRYPHQASLNNDIEYLRNKLGLVKRPSIF